MPKCYLSIFIHKVSGAAGENILHIGPFADNFPDELFQKWAKLVNKKLTNYQWRVVMNASAACPTPLFCKIAFAEVLKWKSYHPKETTFICNTLPSSIAQLLCSLESKYNTTLVEHSLAYITASKYGLSESELEDILSLDDIVLNSIYGHQVKYTLIIMLIFAHCNIWLVTISSYKRSSLRFVLKTK